MGTSWGGTSEGTEKECNGVRAHHLETAELGKCQDRKESERVRGTYPLGTAEGGWDEWVGTPKAEESDLNNCRGVQLGHVLC